MAFKWHGGEAMALSTEGFTVHTPPEPRTHVASQPYSISLGGLCDPVALTPVGSMTVRR